MIFPELVSVEKEEKLLTFDKQNVGIFKSVDKGTNDNTAFILFDFPLCVCPFGRSKARGIVLIFDINYTVFKSVFTARRNLKMSDDDDEPHL